MMLVTTHRSERQRSPAGDSALEKRSLASILRDHGPLPVADAVDIALDVCDDLASAHTNGIVHGDLGMHRVRTHWPRRPGQRVDIFALAENDSAAFSFRASAVAGLVAPEQRESRAVDVRADVWAVGAMLHWMIAGVAPTGDPVARTLAKAPRALAVAIEACLEVDPAKRPQSVSELAEVIASFASSPPDRFEQLARRRSSMEKTKAVRSDLGDVERALGRLDDAALQRELDAAATSPVPAGSLDRLMFAVHQSTGSAIFEKSVPRIDLADLAEEDEEDEDIATVLASPRYTSGDPLDQALSPVASPLSVSPVVLSSELLAPPKEPEVRTVPMTMTVSPRVPVAAPSTSAPPWKIALGIIGAAAAIALGVGIGIELVEHAMARHAAAPPETVVAAEPSAPSKPAARPASERSASEAAAPSKPTSTTKAASNGEASPGVSGAPAVLTPDALPDAPLTAVAALPDVRLATPASLPDAKPAPAATTRAAARPPSRPSSPNPPHTREDGTETETETEASQSSLSDALR